MKITYPNVNPVIIKWVDSTTTPGWSHDHKKSDLGCTTIGHLISKDKDSVIICLSISAEGSECDFMEIPMVAVKSIKRLK